MRPTTICFTNQKGGCGKSSTCFHLAGALAQTGKRVLLLDLDPQGSLSQAFFGSQFVEQLTQHETTTSIFANDELALCQTIIMPTSFSGLEIVPANQTLSQFNTPLPESLGMDQYAVRDYLDDQSQFDFVLIDCPPNLYRCNWSAMLASDWVVIPVPPEDFGTQGLRAVHQAVKNARVLNPQLRRLGHLITRRDGRLLIHRKYEQILRELYADLVFDVIIPEASAFKVAVACRKPVEMSEPSSRAAKLTRSLGREIVARIGAKTARRAA